MRTNGAKSAALIVAFALVAAVLYGCAHTSTGIAKPNQAVTQAEPSGPVLIIRTPPPTRLRRHHSDAPTAGRPDMRLFWEIWDLMKEQHVDSPLSDEQLMRGAIRGMMKFGGDRHSRYITPEQWREQQAEDRGAFYGIGTTLNFKDERLTVVEVVKGGPADRAGIRPGDEIIRIDGQSPKTLGLEKSVRLIRGAKGTPVKLTIRRAGQPAPITVTAVRDEIKIIVAEARLLTGDSRKFAHIRLKGFTGAAADAFAKVVAQALDWKVDGVILDLRGNPGGYISAVRKIASAWLGHRILFVVQTNMGARPIPAEPYPGIHLKLKGVPTVVLVDDGSASASEILAGALQDYRAATIVGVKTYGKGSMQQVHDLSNGGKAAITSNYWKTPAGRVLEENGIVPDVIVKPAEIVPGAKNQPDPQLDRAVEILKRRLAARELMLKDPEVRKVLRMFKRQFAK
jgi:carboxyl-terminal processing protease